MAHACVLVFFERGRKINEMLKFSLKSRNGHPVEFWLFENNIFMVWGRDIARFVGLGR